jgi:hypothetical protein
MLVLVTDYNPKVRLRLRVAAALRADALRFAAFALRVALPFAAAFEALEIAIALLSI